MIEGDVVQVLVPELTELTQISLVLGPFLCIVLTELCYLLNCFLLIFVEHEIFSWFVGGRQ